MSAQPRPVTVPTPSGERRTGELLEERWAPAYAAQDRELATVEVDGTTLTVPAEEVEEL